MFKFNPSLLPSYLVHCQSLIFSLSNQNIEMDKNSTPTQLTLLRFNDLKIPMKIYEI